MNSTAPRLLLEPSDYVLRNIGDMAMLHVATARLRSLLPNARIQVLTDDPEALLALCPSVTPFLARGRHVWLGKDGLRSQLRKYLPPRIAEGLLRCVPASLAEAVERRLFSGEDRCRHKGEFLRAVEECDLLVVAGMGGITDAFVEYASGVLETMNLALGLGCRVAMVGQGFGPLNNPRLRARAAAILPRLDLVALRERRAGEPLLLALGVDPARIIVTGDDAVQLAHDLRRDELGSGIGLNLRQSDYSAVSAHEALEIGKVVSARSAALSSALIPIPISRVPGEADLEALRAIMPDSKEELSAAARLTSPEDVIRQIQRCRLVVTGSYHAGVFALASGIPTIGLAGSPYYEDKFQGLADMFGEGCEVVSLSQDYALEALGEGVERLWGLADDLRPPLLKAAQVQIAAGQAAYRKLAKLAVESRLPR